jgi:hypothetical protein
MIKQTTKLPYKLLVLLHKLHDAGCGPVRSQRGELRCRCPAHEDKGPSLYLAATDDRILLDCKAGCAAQVICRASAH